MGTVAVRDDYPPCQRISAQSPPRHDATISRLDPPSPLVGGLLPQALGSGLQRLEVEPIACDSSRRPAGNLPRRGWQPGQPCPKSNGPPYQAGHLGPIWHSILVQAESLLLLGLNRDHSSHSLHTWPPGPEANSTTQSGRTQFDPRWMRLFWPPVAFKPIAFGSLRVGPKRSASSKPSRWRVASNGPILNDLWPLCLGIGWFRETNRVSAKEFLLNLNPDFVHPSLGPVCPVLEMPDLRLKVLYPLFGGSKLRR